MTVQIKSRNGKTTFVIQFTLNKKRRSICLGNRYTIATAQMVDAVVERCVTAIQTDTPLDHKTQNWLEGLKGELLEKFIASGLVTEETETIGAIWDEFIERDTIRESSRRAYEVYKAMFERFVDPATRVVDFTKDSARAFVAALDRSEYSSASKYGLVRVTRSIFNLAIEKEIIARSPFIGVKTRYSNVNKRREVYIPLDLYEQMLAVCDAEDRMLLAFYRIGGLRHGEPFYLTWDDVDFDRRRIRVTAPKTHSEREIPLFPLLARELAPGDGVVISRNYKYASSLARKLCKDVCRIPKLIQNMRSSASIDIHREYGEIAENAWLGHSESIAKRHYLHVLDSDFDRASRE